jgi:hypothetical protein
MILKEDVYERLINFSQFDIRRLINIMEELSYDDLYFNLNEIWLIVCS